MRKRTLSLSATRGPRAALLALIVLGTIGAAGAQDFPVRPVRMVIPIGPGSSMDITGRVVAQRLNEAWGQPVVTENRPGAGGDGGSVWAPACAGRRSWSGPAPARG